MMPAYQSETLSAHLCNHSCTLLYWYDVIKKTATPTTIMMLSQMSQHDQI